jgi:isochorismate pyruvate lyase
MGSTIDAQRANGTAMPNESKAPDDCESMAEVRAGVDATDRELVALLGRRFGYMRAAARIKQTRDAVRDEDRKASVIKAAQAEAEALGVPADVIADIWERLVEGSIAYELVEWDRIRD